MSRHTDFRRPKTAPISDLRPAAVQTPHPQPVHPTAPAVGARTGQSQAQSVNAAPATSVGSVHPAAPTPQAHSSPPEIAVGARAIPASPISTPVSSPTNQPHLQAALPAPPTTGSRTHLPAAANAAPGTVNSHLPVSPPAVQALQVQQKPTVVGARSSPLTAQAVKPQPATAVQPPTLSFVTPAPIRSSLPLGAARPQEVATAAPVVGARGGAMAATPDVAATKSAFVYDCNTLVGSGHLGRHYSASEKSFIASCQAQFEAQAARADSRDKTLGHVETGLKAAVVAGDVANVGLAVLTAGESIVVGQVLKQGVKIAAKGVAAGSTSPRT